MMWRILRGLGGLVLVLAVSACGQKESAEDAGPPPSEAPPSRFEATIVNAEEIPLRGQAQFDLQPYPTKGDHETFFHAVLYVPGRDARHFDAFSILRMTDGIPPAGRYPLTGGAGEPVLITYMKRAGTNFVSIADAQRGELVVETANEETFAGRFAFQATLMDIATKSAESVEISGTFEAARHSMEKLPIDMDM